MADPLKSGLIESITLLPARLDWLDIRFGIVPNTYRSNNACFSMGKDADVTVDGKKVDLLGLCKWLAEDGHSHFVTINPDPQHYGMSMKTEFSSTEPK